MTDTSTRPARDTATRWERHSSVQTFAELLLGLSFTAAVAFGGYAAATGRMTVLSQAAALVFVVTLTCVVVSWFRAVEREDRPSEGRSDGGRSSRRRAGDDRSRAVTASTDPIAEIDAEYRR